MTAAELTLLITPIVAAIGAAIVALINSRATATELGHVKDDLEVERALRIDLQDKQADARRDIIAIGEQLHEARLDNAVMAEAFNQLFIEFRDVTGHKPAVNLDRLKHMRTISYITGPLDRGPLAQK